MGLVRVKRICLVLLAFLLLLGFAGGAYADEPYSWPNSFYGYVKNAQNEPVTQGTILAYIDNELRGELAFENGQYGLPSDSAFVDRLYVMGTAFDVDKLIQFKVQIGDIVYPATTIPDEVRFTGSLSKRSLDLVIPIAGGTISGLAKLEKVYPSDPEPDHSGTEVKVYHGNDVLGTASTNSDGSYTVNDLPAGSFTLSFTHTGGSWKRAFKTVNVTMGKATDAGTVTLYLGDMNGDDTIDILDLLWMVPMLDGPVNEETIKADVNCDGEIDILDLLRVVPNIEK